MPVKKSAKKPASKSKPKAASKPKAKTKVKPKAKPKKKAVAVAKPKVKASVKPKAKTTVKPKAKAVKKETKKQKVFRTGEKCPQSGLYTHPCTGKGGEKNTIPLSKTETFPPCRSCGSVKWTLVMAA